MYTCIEHFIEECFEQGRYYIIFQSGSRSYCLDWKYM